MSSKESLADVPFAKTLKLSVWAFSLTFCMIYIRICPFHFFQHQLVTFTFAQLWEWYYNIIWDCAITGHLAGKLCILACRTQKFSFWAPRVRRWPEIGILATTELAHFGEAWGMMQEWHNVSVCTCSVLVRTFLFTVWPHSWWWTGKNL